MKRAVSTSVSAPVGGLNGIDALAAMPAADAIQLDNWFPRTGDVVTRNGSATYVSGFAAPVETLMAYRVGTGKMFAISGGSIYDATTASGVGAALVTGLANSRWQYVNFGTPGGRFLYTVNGTDYPLLYDGTTWLKVRDGAGAAIASITAVGTTATLTTSAPHGLVNGASVTVTVTGATPAAYNVTAATINVTSTTTFTYTTASAPGGVATVLGRFTYTPAISGVDSRLLKNCDAINARMWFVEKNSLRAWYLPVNSISGTAQQIDLSSLANLGGNLAAVFGWSVGSSTGQQNYTVFITTEGEVFVFLGYDPTNAATWGLSARGRIGAPVGERFWLRIGTDIIIVGEDGVIELSKAMLIDRSSDSDSVSRKVLSLVNADISANSSLFGWQMALYPAGNMLIVNVPHTENMTAIQYVMNTMTNAWCRYTGLNANCFEYINNKLFFGGANKVYQAETGSSDNGAAIIATARQAFTTFKDPGTLKRFTAVRPSINGVQGAGITFDLNMDYEDKPARSTPALGFTGTPLYWPFAWDSLWAPTLSVSKRLQFASGVGYAVSAKVQATTVSYPVSWQSTVFVFERGQQF